MFYLPEVEYGVALQLIQGGSCSIARLAEVLQLDQSRIHAAGLALAERGLLELLEESFREFSPDEARPAQLPERAIIHALAEAGGRGALTALPTPTGLDQQQIGQSLRWLRSKGWADADGRDLVLTAAGRAALEQPGPDERLLAALAEAGRPLREEELRERVPELDAALELLLKRKGLIRVKSRVERRLRLTPRGQELQAGELACRRQVNLLTPEMLQDGSWRNVDFRPYDVRLATARIHPGKIHPLRRVLDETRRVFLELGFHEYASPQVESSFWDFDALFQPQDHPAREMQDTFYVGRPARTRLPEDAYVAEVAATHEHGGRTGSVGWRYSWKRSVAERPVLRTHNTAATVRALAEYPQAPGKFFLVGKVFRRETIDYKHLPVFYQVDGIIIDERASFAMLLGVLDIFYRKMGFDRFRFQPAFFPYTEPSVEIYVWLEERKDWVEMGGAGVFRPEVTEPAGCHHPVLAWGLGLERLAMLRFGISDIRDLYLADLDWLKGVALCR